MSIDPNLLIAAKLIHDECVKNSSCTNCQLRDICGWESAPNDWEIPDPPPEPNKRQRIEWLRMLPDKEMFTAVENERSRFGCRTCKYYNECEDEEKSCNAGHIGWWHEVVTLNQFRKDVGL